MSGLIFYSIGYSTTSVSLLINTYCSVLKTPHNVPQASLLTFYYTYCEKVYVMSNLNHSECC